MQEHPKMLYASETDYVIAEDLKAEADYRMLGYLEYNEMRDEKGKAAKKGKKTGGDKKAEEDEKSVS